LRDGAFTGPKILRAFEPLRPAIGRILSFFLAAIHLQIEQVKTVVHHLDAAAVVQ